MMVEVPAAALTIEDFNADFFSIGSNDLIQYVAAASRDEPQLADLARPSRAVFGLIGHVVDYAEPLRPRSEPVRRSCGRSRASCGASRSGFAHLFGGTRRARSCQGLRSPAIPVLRHEHGSYAGRFAGSHCCLQGYPARCARQAAVRHAPASGRGPRQESQLHHADCQPGLSDADPGAARPPHHTDLPFLGAGEGPVSRSLSPRAPAAAAAPEGTGARPTSHA